MSPPLTPEQIAALSPQSQTILRAVIDFYEQRCAKLEARIVELESRTKPSPQNSSLPPSSVHPHAKPKRPTPPNRRKRGG